MSKHFCLTLSGTELTVDDLMTVTLFARAYFVAPKVEFMPNVAGTFAWLRIEASEMVAPPSIELPVYPPITAMSPVVVESPADEPAAPPAAKPVEPPAPPPSVVPHDQLCPECGEPFGGAISLGLHRRKEHGVISPHSKEAKAQRQSPPSKGGRPRSEIRHGTYGGAQAHRRRDEQPCDPCSAAERRVKKIEDRATAKAAREAARAEFAAVTGADRTTATDPAAEDASTADQVDGVPMGYRCRDTDCDFVVPRFPAGLKKLIEHHHQDHERVTDAEDRIAVELTDDEIERTAA